MKKIMLSLVITGFCWACKDDEKKTKTIEETYTTSISFDWLLGEWQRTNEQEGKETFESWEKLSDSEYKGLGFTTQNSDTIWLENIILINRDTGWNFEVTGKGESEPTIYRITKIESDSFDLENQENEFPKVISYYRAGSKLKAVISGGGTEIPFDFETVKN